VKLFRIVPLVAVSLLALSGCAQGGGVAAHVGDGSVRSSDVDLLSSVSCNDLNQGAGQATTPQTTPVSLVRMQALNALVNNELITQLAKKEHATYDRSKLLSQMSGIDDQLTSIPADERQRLRELVQKFDIGQLQLTDLGHQQLAASGGGTATDQQALQAGYTLMQQYAKTIHISIDPQYAPNEKGQPGGGTRSLSTAVSDYAKQSDSTSPRPSWAIGLPVNQKCG
jgi:hypothetical protein